MSNISWWNNWAILLSFSRFHYSSLSFSFTFFFLTIWQTCCCLCPRPCSCPANCSCPQTCPRSHPHSLAGKKDLETGVREGYPGEAKGCFTGYFGLGCGHLKASIPKLLPDPNNNARPCQIGISSWAPSKTRLPSFNYTQEDSYSRLESFNRNCLKTTSAAPSPCLHRYHTDEYSLGKWWEAFTWYLDLASPRLSSSRIIFLALASMWPANPVLPLFNYKAAAPALIRL